ncbi:MAG: hypothetical protein JW896_14225, partial [Deltaproteobacteria bacterium]|nr:hypothetical protein [Deltaproteobacteria bacterium]
SRYRVESENNDAVTKNDPVEFEYTYAKDCFVLTEWQGWPSLFSFSWPLIVLLGRWRSSKIRESQVTQWMEILLCLGSGYVIWALSSFGQRLFGAYVVLSGMALYLIAAVRDPIHSVARYMQTRKTERQL